MNKRRSPLDVLVWPLDRLRWMLLKMLGRWVRPFLVHRELRVATGGAALIVLVWLGTLAVPFWMLALGPIIWGVPHVLSDVRYLVVRPGHHRRWELIFAAGIPLAAVAVGSVGVLGGLTAAAGVMIVGHGQTWRKAAGLAVLAFLGYWAWRYEYMAALIFAHAHNFIAVALWWFWRRRAGHLHWVPLVLFVLISLSLLGGVMEPLVQWTGALVWTPQGMGQGYHLSSLAPGMSYTWGIRLVLLFTFAQAMHYSVWLRLIPEDDRPRPTPRTYAATFRALRDDLGSWVLLLASITAAVFVCWAVFDLMTARVSYLRMALFHGHLELAAAALWWVEGVPAHGVSKKERDQKRTHAPADAS